MDSSALSCPTPPAEPRWRSAAEWRARIPPRWRGWLLDDGSLTRRLQRRCGAAFRVEVLAQDYARPWRSEVRALGIERAQRCVVREVLLCCGVQPWIYARTIMPVRSLSGTARRLRTLGARPLGAALFADPSMRRGAVEVTRLAGDAGVLPRRLAVVEAGIWGRRSVFRLRDRPLLVSEFFLPALLNGKV